MSEYSEIKSNLNSVLKTVAGMDAKLSSIQTQLPEVARLAAEARDGTIQLREQNKSLFHRVSALESVPPVTCDKEEVLDRLSASVAHHDTALSSLEKNTQTFLTLGKWLIGILLAFALSFVGWQWKEAGRIQTQLRQADARTSEADKLANETKRSVEKLEKAVNTRQEEMVELLRGHHGILHD